MGCWFSTLQTSSNSQMGPDQAANHTAVPSKLKQLRWALATGVLTILLSTFSIFYAYEALLSERPVLGPLLLSPSRTVLFIPILTQILVHLFKTLFHALFQMMRWQMASRETGVELTTFLALSAGTSMLGVLHLLKERGGHRVWAVQRYVLLECCWLISVMLTFDITFKYVFTPDQFTSMNVFAGLTPFDISLTQLPGFPISVMCIYVSSLANTLLSDSKFSQGIGPVSCSGDDCFSYFLPGGIENVRMWNDNLNTTLLSTKLLNNAPVVLINDAPGYQLDFLTVDSGFVFNRTSDCMTFYGQNYGDGLYFCVAQSNSNTVVAGQHAFRCSNSPGWTICPSSIYDRNGCFGDNSWINLPETSTSLSIYKRYATVAYDSRNISILSIEKISSPVPANVEARDFLTYFSAFLNPSSPLANDTMMSNAAMFSIGWVLRLYQDLYQADRDDPLAFLRGVLTIPFQFSVTALQFINSRVQQKYPQISSGTFAIPPDLETTATLSGSSYRAIAAPWTVQLFVSTTVLLLLCAICMLIWVATRSVVILNTSSFLEIDILSNLAPSSARIQETSVDGGPETVADSDNLSSMLRNKGLANVGSDKVIVREIDGKKICATLEGVTVQA